MRFLFLCCWKTVAQMRTTAFNLPCVSCHRRVDLLTDCYITASQLRALMLIVQKQKKSWKASWTLSPWQYDEMYQLIWHPPGRCYKGYFPILICKDQRSRDKTSPSLFIFICFRLPAETLMPVSVSLFLTEAGVPLPRWQHRLHFAWEKRDSESERAKNIYDFKIIEK